VTTETQVVLEKNMRSYSGLSVSGRHEWYIWFFVVLWPLLGVGFVVLDCSMERSFGSVLVPIGYALLVLGSFCVSGYTLLFSRSAGYKVLKPEVVQTPSGVLVTADYKFDPDAASVLLRLGCASVIFGVLFALMLGGGDPGPESVSITFRTIFAGVGIIFLIRATQFWCRRKFCRRHPGDIELSYEGIRQWRGNHIACASWRYIEGWSGVKKNDLGEFQDFWEAISRSEVYYPASRDPVMFSSTRRQRFKLILNPVSDVYTMHALIHAAQENLDWAHELFTAPDRVKRVHDMLAVSDDVVATK
jgi:hypothetical protein